MAGSLGTIYGQIKLDVGSAIAAYAAVRSANATTFNAMQDGSRRMRSFGLAATAMGASMLAAFGMAVNAAADFEKKLDYFGAVNNATAEEMEKVRQKALQLGRDTHLSAAQVADAMVEMGKAGIGVEDILGGMADALVNLAAAADIDMATATRLVTGQLQAFSLEAKDAAHVTDLMAGAANASIIDIEDVGVSMKYVAGVANSMGLSIDSTTHAIALLGKAGIKGSTAGTSMRQMLVSLAGGTEKAKGVLEELGIITQDGTNKFFDQNGRVKDLASVFQVLQDHTADLSQKERIMAMRTIFNNRALAAASILTKEGAAGFKEMAAEMSKTTAADVAAKRLDNLSGDITILKGNLETMLIEGGTPFQEFLRTIVQGLTRVVQWFGRLPDSVQTGIFAFLLVGGVIAVLAGGIALMGAAFMGAIGTLGKLGGAFKFLTTMIRILTVATIQQTAAALANPYVLLAMAVVALIVGLVLLYKRSEGFRKFMDAMGRGIKDAWNATIDWFKGLPKFFSDLWDDIVRYFEMGVEWVKKNWDILLALLTGPLGAIVFVIRRFGDDILNFITSIPDMIGKFISDSWESLMGFLSKLPYYIGFIIGWVLGTLTKWGIAAVVWATSTGEKIMNGITWFFTELPVEIAFWLLETWNKFVVWSVDMVEKAKQTARDIYYGVVDWFKKLPGRVAYWALMLYYKAGEIWDRTVAWAKRTASNIYHGFMDWLIKLPGRVADKFWAMYNKAVSAGIRLRDWAWNLGKRVYHGLMDWLIGIPARVWGIVDGAVRAFKDMVSWAYSQAKEFARGLWDGFKDGLGIRSPSYIEKAMWAITDVTGTETARLRGQVKSIQGLARSLQDAEPKWTGLSTRQGAILEMMKAAKEARIQASILGPDASQLGLRPKMKPLEPGKTSDYSSKQPDIQVNVYNPVPERASDTTARKLRTLSEMGAFG